MSRWRQARLLPRVSLVSFPERTLSGPHGRSSTHVTEILRDRVEVPSNKNTLNGFRTFCSGKDLTMKRCVTCNMEDLRPMTEQAAKELIRKIPEWDLVNEGGKLRLSRSWKVKTFLKGLDFFRAIGNLAEAEGHHPDLHLVRWNNVKIEIWTHSVGGLTENDFILAAKIDRLDLHDLLGRKASY